MVMPVRFERAEEQGDQLPLRRDEQGDRKIKRTSIPACSVPGHERLDIVEELSDDEIGAGELLLVEELNVHLLIL